MSVIPPIVHDYATATKDFPVVDVHRECATIRYDSHDYKGVIRAINDLHKDIERVTGAKTNVSADAVSGKYEIIIGTLGKSKVIDALAASGKIKLRNLQGMRYMYKTVRKYFGEAIVVTQEVDDIISSPVVKESIINNSDCKILLDQRKYMNKFDQIQALLGLTEKEKSQILSINMANNPSRLYKEVWIGLGGTQSAVYATEVSAEEYLAYTTEETEKVEVYRLAEQLGGDIEAAIRQLAERRRNKQ